MTTSSITTQVSVIIPVFNNERGLYACLNGLRAQTYPNNSFEVVIADNGSVPPLATPVGFPFRIVVERCIQPGSYAARNAAARVARGEIFAFVDADCVPSPSWIDCGVQALLTGQRKQMVGGPVLVSQPSLRSGTALYQHSVGFQQRENIEQKGFSATANLFCTADHFRTVGPFDERLLSGGDREWAWRAKRKAISLIFQPDAIVRTSARTSLCSAIRQARRVAAGRLYIRRNGLDHLGSGALLPHRPPVAAMRWILTQSQLSIWERAKVLAAAIVIRIATYAETIRLRLGGSAERR